MQSIINFFNSDFMVLVGGFSTVFLIITFLYTVYLIAKGVIPVWIRLGLGLTRGKIAIFAKDGFDTISTLLIDSKIFRKSNIIQINKDRIAKIKGSNIILIYWPEAKDYIDQILHHANYCTPIIVYAPRAQGDVRPEDMDKINAHANSIIVNLRGRLLNDIVISLITASYE